MDIEGIQATLRRFAADRGWQPFHTPKNLASALMVEAAELLEIFQWLTPEQSRTAHRDPAVQQHIGEELADVLLYLLQVADHTQVDLQRAAFDKLAKNARKYPAPGKADLDRPVDTAGEATHVLLDYENVQPSEDELRALVPEATRVWVFHGPHQKQIAERFSSYGEGLTAVPISRSGKNALDFHLSFYMGYIASRNQAAHIVVVANDMGYSPMLEHAKAMGFDVRQLGHARRAAAPAKTAARKGAARKAVAKPPSPSPAARQAAAKQPTARPPAAKKAAAKAPPSRAPAKPDAGQAPAAAPPPAKKATRPAAKKSAAAAPPPARKAPASKPAAGRASARKTAAPSPAPTPAAAPAAPDLVRKIIENLRKMGPAKRPVKASSLRRMLKPLLGTTSSDAAIAAAFDALVASGAVTVNARGEVGYPQFS